MIAEYESAQIMERYRRGKIHRQAGQLNVLSGAPFGYRYLPRASMRKRRLRDPAARGRPRR